MYFWTMGMMFQVWYFIPRGRSTLDPVDRSLRTLLHMAQFGWWFDICYLLFVYSVYSKIEIEIEDICIPVDRKCRDTLVSRVSILLLVGSYTEYVCILTPLCVPTVLYYVHRMYTYTLENWLDERIQILLQIHFHPLLGLFVTSSGCFGLWLA